MLLRRDPSKALQIGFLVLLVVSTVQVSWWIYDTVQNTGAVEQRFQASYRAEAEAAQALAARGVAAAAIRTLAPHADVDPATRDARVSPDALAALARERARRNNRMLWEGGFFLLVLVGGMTVLTRTIRHDAELRRRQQNFLAAVSHEFKSPLASVRLAAETLILRSKEPDTQRLAQRIVEDGDRLLRMVDNLLETTRLEEGRHALSPTLVSVRSVTESAAAEMAERARHNGIELALHVPAQLALTVDRTALEMALRNLLDNAIKACIAGHGKSVNVRAERTDHGVELAVSDDGLGFPPQDAAMIFEKFYRLGDELRRSTPGTGLGLYIVKRLVELSGGHISAESDGPGQGATVTIVWPDSRTP
jgi:signal transduction histidine kinase